MRIVMAVSVDGFVSKGDGDHDMDWTGSDDKKVFRLLTNVGGFPLGAGRKTFELLPKLPGRSVVSISRDPAKGCRLESFHKQFPHAWLIGGQGVALEAVRLGMVEEVFLSWCPDPLFRGVKASPELLEFGHRAASFKVDDARVEVRR